MYPIDVIGSVELDKMISNVEKKPLNSHGGGTLSYTSIRIRDNARKD